MRKRYKRICFRDEVLLEFQKRAKALGVTYSDFLKRLLAENEMKKTKELREFLSYLAGIDEKLDYIIMQFGVLQPSGSSQSGISSQQSGGSSDLRLILELVKVFGEKFILLPQRKNEFLSFVQQLEQQRQDVDVLMLFDTFKVLVRYLIVNENERRSLEEKIEQLKKKVEGQKA